jgi:hypothetical protein
MKALLTSFAALLMTSMISAQSEQAKDTTRISLPEMEILIVNKEPSATDSVKGTNEMTDDERKEKLTYFAGLDLGVNFLLNGSGTTGFEGEDSWLDNDPARSLSWRWNMAEQKIRIVKDYMGITTGLAIAWNSYTFTNNIRVVNNSDSTWGVVDSLPNYSKNKLRTTHLQVPLLLSLNSSLNPDRNFHIDMGVIGGLRIGSRTKQKYDIDGRTQRETTVDDFNLAPVSLDATVRVGYRNFTLWASYGLTSLFRDGKGPEAYPLAVGLTVLPF